MPSLPQRSFDCHETTTNPTHLPDKEYPVHRLLLQWSPSQVPRIPSARRMVIGGSFQGPQIPERTLPPEQGDSLWQEGGKGVWELKEEMDMCLSVRICENKRDEWRNREGGNVTKKQTERETEKRSQQWEKEAGSFYYLSGIPLVKQFSPKLQVLL